MLARVRVDSPRIGDPDSVPVASASALLRHDPSEYKMTVIANGPGMHLNIAFSAGGKYVEAACRQGAKLLGLGPSAASEAIEAFFGDDAERLEKLDELYSLRFEGSYLSTGATPDTPTGASKTVTKLRKLCGVILRYTRSSHLPETRLVAFKSIVRLTTRYIGIRALFIALIVPNLEQQPTRSSIVSLWRDDGWVGDHEWEFFLNYAAHCVAGPDAITGIVESMRPAQFGNFEGGLCVSDRLSSWVTNTLSTADLSRLVAVRYLGGILELSKFWENRLMNDFHSLLHVLCALSIRVLEDLAVDCQSRGAIFVHDLVTLDPEGIHMMIHAVISRLPVASNTSNESRSNDTLKAGGRLINLLQRQVFLLWISSLITNRWATSERSKVLFPEAAKRAEMLFFNVAEHTLLHAEAARHDMDGQTHKNIEHEPNIRAEMDGKSQNPGTSKEKSNLRNRLKRWTERLNERKVDSGLENPEAEDDFVFIPGNRASYQQSGRIHVEYRRPSRDSILEYSDVHNEANRHSAATATYAQSQDLSLPTTHAPTSLKRSSPVPSRRTSHAGRLPPPPAAAYNPSRQSTLERDRSLQKAHRDTAATRAIYQSRFTPGRYTPPPRKRSSPITTRGAFSSGRSSPPMHMEHHRPSRAVQELNDLLDEASRRAAPFHGLHGPATLTEPFPVISRRASLVIQFPPPPVAAYNPSRQSILERNRSLRKARRHTAATRAA
ncbi:hypothetical protein HWV62_19887 [Athelia sp. TMB]|nr:hypothetical protein HWV62_19887 [Athelia sp. TMB]